VHEKNVVEILKAPQHSSPRDGGVESGRRRRGISERSGRRSVGGGGAASAADGERTSLKLS